MKKLVVKVKKHSAKFLRVRQNCIPKILKQLKQWVCWKAIRKGDDWTKVPFNPISKQGASINNPDDWTNFSTAYRSYKNNDLDGIGFVLTDDDPFVGIDIDNCVDPKTGRIHNWVKLIIEYLDSFTEFSPSGEGIRIFTKGKLPPGRRKKKNIEFYDSKRYLTVTGHHLEGTPKKILPREKRVGMLHSKIFEKDKESPIKSRANGEDIQRLKIAYKSKNGQKIKRLFEGNFYGYDSKSEADLALCAHLAFWFDRDPVKIDRVFRASGLFREKWNKVIGSTTYGQMTIQEAVDSTSAVYQAPITPEIITAAELYKKQLPKIRWLVRGLLPEGLIILAGKPKVGKSWLSFQLCIAITRKMLFLKAITKKKNVMYLALEDSYGRLKSRLNSLLDGKKPPKNLYLSNYWPKINQSGLKQLEKEIIEKKLKLVVIDTFQKVRPKASGKRNLYHVDYEDVSAIKSLADQHRITILLIHHLRKADAEDVLDTVSGSTGLTGSADGTLILEKDRGSLNATLSITGRDHQDRKILLVFDEKSTTWSYVGEADAHYRNKERQDILDVIDDAGGPIGPKEIAERLDLPESKYQNVRQLVSKMFKSGELVKVGYGKYDVPNREKHTDHTDNRD